MTEKPVTHSEFKEVKYTSQHWRLLKQLRQKAALVMKALQVANINSMAHGSIARGDVDEKSDLDVFIPFQASSFLVENALEKAGISIARRLIVQATPKYAMKAYIEVDEKTSVSFPLMQMRKIERELYKFSGETTLEDLKDNMRVAGVDKRLILIEPTELGHRENTIIGREGQTAKLLNVSAETVSDRVHALLRRDQVGRTGVFIKRELAADETFELALKKLADQNPAVRRRLATTR